MGVNVSACAMGGVAILCGTLARAEPAVDPPPPKSDEAPVFGKWGPENISGFVELDCHRRLDRELQRRHGQRTDRAPGNVCGGPRALDPGGPPTRAWVFIWEPAGRGRSARLGGRRVGLSRPLSEQHRRGDHVYEPPFARLRHAWLKLETPIVDLTVGQTWQLLGWQPYFHVNTVAVQGVPAQVYSRAPRRSGFRVWSVEKR